MRRALLSTTTIAMVLAGLALSTTAITAHGTDLRSQRAQDLKSLVLARAKDAAFAEQSIANLRAEVNALAIQYTSKELRNIRKQIAALRPSLGLTPVEGAGVVVTLNDAPESDDPSIDPNWLLVHQQDLEAVINALWLAHAEAITVMGQRIVETSAVRCVGSTVLINGKVFSPPFVIRAVGKPLELLKALERDKNIKFFRDLAATFGLTYDVQTVPSIYIPAYEGSLTIHVAQPISPAAGLD